MTDVEVKSISAAIVNTWLAMNLKHMESATISAPSWWYDGSDGTCSA